MEQELYQKLVNGKKAIISHYLNPKMILIVKLANKLRRKNEKIIIVDPRNIIQTRYAHLLLDDIILTNKPPRETKVNTLFIIEPEYLNPYKIMAENIILTLTPGNYRFKVPREYEKIILVKTQDTYMLYFKDTNEKYRFKIVNNQIKTIIKPPGIIGEAYDLLKKSMIEYGEITVKDATIILVKELGISKEEARKILSKLILEKYIRVIHGKINIY